MRIRRLVFGSAAATALLVALPGVAAAADGGTIDTGDTAWMLMSTALVMIMLPGLALFYGGLVRRKNVLSTIMHSFFGLALVSIVWVIVGFTLAFGPDVDLPVIGHGWIGNLDFAMFNGVGQAPSAVYAVTIPFMLFAMFQLMFAAITPALITGAFAERKRFGSFVLFTILWSILIYSPIAHWVWSTDGWLFKAGALDFAGGTVVHISSGVSALVVALMIGRRKMNGEKSEPHDVPMTVLGAGLLWFGWFGFNAGSALTAGGLAASAFTVTNIAAAAATVTWVLASYVHTRKVSVVGAACGAVAGLVAITPASGFVTPGGALIIGLVGRRPVLQRDAAAGPLPRRRRARRLRGPRRRRHVRCHRDRHLRLVHRPGRVLRPARRQPAAGGHPGRRGRSPPSSTRPSARSSSSRSSTSCSASGSSPKSRRWAWTSRSTARRPTRPDPHNGPVRSPGRHPPRSAAGHPAADWESPMTNDGAPQRTEPEPAPPGATALRRALRARCLRGRVRGGRRRQVECTHPRPRPRRSRRPGSPGRLRG